MIAYASGVEHRMDSHDRLESLLEHCPAMLFAAGADTTILHASRALAEALGLSPGQTATVASLVIPEERSDFNAAWARLSGAEAPIQIDCHLRVKDGSYKPFALRARADREGGDIYGEVRTAEQRVDVKLKSRVLRAIIDNLPIVVWSVDKNGVFLYQEGKGLEAMGLRPGHFVGQNVLEILSGVPKQVEIIKEVLAGEPSHAVETTFGVVWEGWNFPVRDDNGDLSGMVGISLDVTESKRVEEELR
jgi:rsbT co-antagonist protein RsbR